MLGKTAKAAAVLGVMAAATAAGCERPWRIYDPQALGQASKLLVAPAVGAPGGEGPKAGAVETGLLISALHETGRFAVEGPGRLRKAVAAASADPSGQWSPALQGKLVGELGADLLVLGEVIDYRAVTEQKQASFYFGRKDWTESTCWAGVNVRLVTPKEGHLVYFGTGQAKSQQGFGPALVGATDEALIGVREFLAGNGGRREASGRGPE